MIEPLVFDTDCISAFLWVGEEDLLWKLYPKRLLIPRQVYIELSHPAVSHLRARIDTMLASGKISIADILVGSTEYRLYHRMTIQPDPGCKIIGKGEASCIAIAKKCGGMVASNNLADILGYIAEFQLEHVTTGMILHHAFEQALVSEHEANTLWAMMLKKRRKLGAGSFTEYLKKFGLS